MVCVRATSKMSSRSALVYYSSTFCENIAKFVSLYVCQTQASFFFSGIRGLPKVNSPKIIASNADTTKLAPVVLRTVASRSEVVPEGLYKAGQLGHECCS